MLGRHQYGSSYALTQAFIPVRKLKWVQEGKHFPNPLFCSLELCFPPSFTPNPPFSLSGKLRFISLVGILDCQSDQLSVSRALHGSSNYIPVQLARAPRSCGAAIVIEASLGYRWIERSVGQSLAVIARVGGEALLQQSEQGPGCLIWLLHAARCVQGGVHYQFSPLSFSPLCPQCFSSLLTSL